MKTIILRVAFIVSIIFFGISSAQVTNSYFSVGGEYTISEYQRSLIKSEVRQKIIERNKRLQDESDYVEYSSDDYYESNTNYYSNSNGIQNDFVPYVPAKSYIHVRAIPYTPTYSFQKDKSFYAYRVNNSCNNINKNYELKKSYFTPELNRLLINKNLGYSLHSDTIHYYNYFFTYSNNYYVNKYDNNNTKAVIKGYINDLIKRNFDNLDKINIIIEDDISELKDRLDNCYDNRNYSNVDLLKNNLKVLYKIQDRIEDNRETLKDLMYYYNR